MFCFNDSMEKKKIISYLLLILLLALSVRTIKVMTKPIVCRDSILYINIANEWAEFGSSALVPSFPPTYPFVLAMGQRYFGLNPEVTGNIVGIVLGTLIPLAVFFMAFSFFNSYRLALIAALLAAVHPYLIRMSTLILRGAIYLPLLAFALAFALSAIKNRSLIMWCFFSLFLALAAMTRIEGFFVLPIFFIWIIYELFSSKQPFLQRFRYLFLASCLVILIYFGLTYMVRLSLSLATNSSWSNIDLFSLKYTGRL